MESTFLQKIVLCLVIGAAAAGMFEWYRVFVLQADAALNGKYKGSHSISTSH